MSCSRSITSVWEERASLSLIMWFPFGEVSSSSGCLGWAAGFFYCGTPLAFHIIILEIKPIAVYLTRFYMYMLQDWALASGWVFIH